MENRNLLHYFIITLKGMAMGAADVVPGVSGGTIAFISGIYEELITSINNINLSLITTWKKEGFKIFWQKLKPIDSQRIGLIGLEVLPKVTKSLKGGLWVLYCRNDDGSAKPDSKSPSFT